MSRRAWVLLLAATVVVCSGCAIRKARLAALETEKQAVAAQQAAAARAAQEKDVLAFDDFNGKLNLKWEIKNPDPTHYSLTKKPGTLTISAQAGGFSRGSTDYKNLFLIDCPTAPAGKDLQVTLCAVGFKPQGDWNQVGLAFWNDEDNYLKWDLEWSTRRVLMTIGETNSEWAFQQGYDPPEDTGELWLRVVKHGNRYALQAGSDGKAFKTSGEQTWGDGNVKKIGILAKNGPNSQAPEVDASLKLFEVKAIPAASGQ